MQYLPDQNENLIAKRFEIWLSEMERCGRLFLPTRLEKAFYQSDFLGHRIANLPQVQWQAYYRGLMRGEQWLLRHILKRKPRSFVSLGCGPGAWCFFASICGVKKSIGIDLSADDIEIADTFAREHFPQYSRNEVRFVRGNLFDVEYEQPVDIFYLRDTIHHILPTADLLEYLHRNLALDGIVVIHDVNGLCPLSQLRALHARGLRTREMRRDPETGVTRDHALEDYFTLPGILLRLSNGGFRTVYKQACVGGRAHAGDALWGYCLEPLSRSLLLGSLLAPTYQIVAEKS